MRLCARIFCYLSGTKCLWFSFLLTLLLSLIFVVVMLVWQFTIIDEMFDADQIRQHLDALSPQQKLAHAWLTATVDVLYPFAYAAFFIGVSHRSFGPHRWWLLIPSVLVVPADLIEGYSQVMLLNGHEGYMSIKLVATPIKLGLFLPGMAITLSGLLLLLKRRMQR